MADEASRVLIRTAVIDTPLQAFPAARFVRRLAKPDPDLKVKNPAG
jgi:hypothetical protein